MSEHEPSWEELESYLKAKAWEGHWISPKIGFFKAMGLRIRIDTDEGIDTAIARIAIEEGRHPADVYKDIIDGIDLVPGAEQPLETLFEHPKGVILGRPFHSDEFGQVDVYLIDDETLPASRHYFMVRTTVTYNDGVDYRWKAFHGPVMCYDGLAGGDKREAFEEALAHYESRLSGPTGDQPS